MGDAVERIIEPYVNDYLTIEAHRNLILLCAMAWNLSVIEHLASQSDKGDLLETARADVERLGATVVVEKLKKRKTALFPDDHRYIVDTSLEPSKSGGWYLNVASISPEQLEHETPASEHADSAGADGREIERADAAAHSTGRRPVP